MVNELVKLINCFFDRYWCVGAEIDAYFACMSDNVSDFCWLVDFIVLLMKFEVLFACWWKFCLICFYEWLCCWYVPWVRRKCFVCRAILTVLGLIASEICDSEADKVCIAALRAHLGSPLCSLNNAQAPFAGSRSPKGYARLIARTEGRRARDRRKVSDQWAAEEKTRFAG